MAKIVDPDDLQRCPECGEAIKCDEPIPCLNQFHEQEPEMIVSNRQMYDSLMETLRWWQ